MKHRTSSRSALVFSLGLGLIHPVVHELAGAQSSTSETNAGSKATGDDRIHAGHIDAPPGSETLNVNVPENGLQMFESDSFKGTQADVNNVPLAFTTGGLNELPSGFPDSLSSIRWNLRPGLVVVFYEDGNGRGEQLILWGKGQFSALSKFDFNDKASRWAWFDIGGSHTQHERSAGAMIPPYGSQTVSATVPADTVQLFVDKDFKNTMQQVNPVTAQKAGDLHAMPKETGDSLTAMRWNLPDGVIVVLHQDANGKKQQVAIWGQGQIANLDAWDFNDKASRWCWSYIGERHDGHRH